MNPAPTAQQPAAAIRKSILDLSHQEARAFLLKAENYCNLELPPYIAFQALLNGVDQVLTDKKLSSMAKMKEVRDHDDVNHTILHNKDGRYAWRPFQLIHPALYVSLVHVITDEAQWAFIRDRFQSFAKNPNIRCLSLPVASTTEQTDRAEQVSQWWQQVEQRAIALSLDYDHVLETDITDCYGAIYTHSIAWVLHTKPVAKAKRTDATLIGNVIDNHIQDMRHGQTNGIPQGSVLMDFIAEMVLGFTDLELSKILTQEDISDFHILRYRDDYRVFVNNPQDGDAIIKAITEITASLGLKLNPSKTRASADVVRSSIKNDKMAWMSRKQRERDLQKHLLLIHDHANSYPNSGSLARALGDYQKRLMKATLQQDSLMPMIAITVDIAWRNPRTYAVSAAILSLLLEKMEDDAEKVATVQRIQKKFSKLPNTGHMQLWLQRVTLPISKYIDYDEALCKLVVEESTRLWNTDWISSGGLKSAVDARKAIDKTARDQLAPTIQRDEFELFLSNLDGYDG
ncbi:MAG: RNA-directed DNA polymerase [Comamonadaceae bacterium]|nr:RNA-directed DNA polymerase [Burkholderiales bacterium]MEB2347457.1 RNA-directed DNA polymerase [Comamonadaceae bacterium]